MSWLGQSILDGIIYAVGVAWNWALSLTLGFIPNFVLVTILVVVGIVVYLKYGIRGIVAFGAAVLAAMELQRRSQSGTGRDDTEVPGPDGTPALRKPRKRRGKRVFDLDTNTWKDV